MWPRPELAWERTTHGVEDWEENYDGDFCKESTSEALEGLDQKTDMI